MDAKMADTILTLAYLLNDARRNYEILLRRVEELQQYKDEKEIPF